MKNNQFYIDIHAIQTLPPSNINRDDIGSPKTAQYGGVTRARVSSQAWKRAMRQYFIEHLDANKLGTRTLELVAYIVDKIQNIDNTIDDETANTMAEKVIKGAGLSLATKKKNSTQKYAKLKALFFIGNQQAEQLAQAAIDGVTDKKALKAILDDNPSVDMALFGRMVADDPTMNEDASAEVSHAISTHGVETEYDFYTATDDFSQADNSGAGMLGTTEYNSSTLYRYANINGHELLGQLGNADQTVKTIQLFVEAFVKSMPTGKVNSFANQTLPQAVAITIRPDRPVNLVSGFEKPISSSDGYVSGSINELKDAFAQAQPFVDEPVVTLTVGMDDFGKSETTLNDLLSDLGDQLQSLVSKD